MLDVSGIYSQSLHPVFFPGFVIAYPKNRLSGNLVGISINLCKSIQKELFINDTP